ncbi:MAG: cytochrome C peroxidase [Deltaproteobacteria bacterium]|jgi:cytochrome c peroxidase|nr:cytochrome C peroxidase [Deltaproteobacteria bacterium]
MGETKLRAAGNRYLAVWLVCLGCGVADGAPQNVDESTAALTGDGTIPRVPNPPLQADLNNLPGDLRAIAVPEPPNLADFVKDRAAAIRLGKALFWDMQMGSDGVQACASCHFRAGADPRSKNQVSPGLKHIPAKDITFTTGGANYQLESSDFPLTRLAVAGTRGALDPATDSDDAVSSQGVFNNEFVRTRPGRTRDVTISTPDDDGFRVDGRNVRRVEPRNTPSMINAVFNHRQFWDGRAEAVFNGVNHLGTRDPNARVYQADSAGQLSQVQVALTNASLASQAVAPLISDLEMSATGRTNAEIGRKLGMVLERRRYVRWVLPLRPLGKQRVSPTDSVLGDLSRWPRAGLDKLSYEQMIAEAFQDTWWKSNKLVRVYPNGTTAIVDGYDRDTNTTEYSLMQYNFALFFGLAVQMYEATLVSDDTPWDRFRRENPTATDPDLNPWTNTNPNHISRLALFGAMLFNDRTRGPTNIRCSNCHEQAEMTDASVRRIAAATNGPVRNRDGNIIDKGFNNIGVRPTDDDLGVGATDAFGPLSHARRLFPGAAPATFDGAAVTLGFGLEGAFKIPSLRNVALTAPYFHNGDASTLRQVVELYSRGGNVFPVQTLDGTRIEPLGVPTLTSDEIDAIVAFLESLTDERVRIAAAPFDHPEIFVPNGHPGDQFETRGGRKEARDIFVHIPAVGAAGGAPLPGFLEGVFGPAGNEPCGPFNGYDDDHDDSDSDD